MGQTMNGWHKNLPPERTQQQTGQRAQHLVAETLALEAERHRIRVEGPTPQPQQKVQP